MNKRPQQETVKQQIRVYGPALVLVLAGFAIAYQFIKPAPPDRVVMATGSEQGAYHAYAQRYAQALAREGIALQLRPTAGSVENLALLQAGEVDVAFVQGGVGESEPGPELKSLGSLYYEPLWLFHRAEAPLRTVADLAGRRLAVGSAGSGTRALVMRLLGENGISASQAELHQVGSADGMQALLSGQVDAAFFVTSASSALVDRLLREPGIRLASFDRAPAYARRFRYLSEVILPEGAVDLARNIPDRDVRLLAPAANLVAHPGLHPAISDLLLQAADAVHSGGGWFEEQGQFPMAGLLAYPLSKEAARYYKYGPPLLQRFLPFWAASLVDRLKVMLLPLVVLMIPLIKVMPPIYTWRMRARVYRWYDELEEIDAQLQHAAPDAVNGLLDRLAGLENEVRQVRVPLSYADQLYHLREHIDLVRRRHREQAGHEPASY